MKKLTWEFVESDAKIILEALIEKENVMAPICATSDDKDEIADVGNDLVELRLLLNELRKQAVTLFGASVMEFGKESL